MRPSKFHLCLLTVAATGSLLLYEFPPTGAPPGLIGNGLQVVASGLAMWFLFRVYRAFGREDRVRTGWLFMALALTAQTCGFAIFGALELLGTADPFPSLADLFWLLSYPLELVALLLLAAEYRRGGLATASARSGGLAGTVAVGLAVLFFVMPYLRDDALPILNKAILMLYPLGDAFFVGGAWYMASLVRPFGRGALTWPWYAMIVGTLLIAASDALYALLELKGVYQTGEIVDLGWVFGALFIALGGWFQHRLMSYDLAAGGELQ